MKNDVNMFLRQLLKTYRVNFFLPIRLKPEIRIWNFKKMYFPHYFV